MIEISTRDLKSPSKFRIKLGNFIKYLRSEIINNYKINFDYEELSDLLLSTCRLNDFGVLRKENRSFILDESRIWEWIKEKLIPSTLVLSLDDPEVLKLLIFSLEITYQMFLGGTRATITQKGFRERRRTFESILVDQFIGKLGEIFVKNILRRTLKLALN